ncbi:MAG: cytochrome c biogenesis protein DipZ [Proteobacteria bacterium]|nr:MAG: cytochrome c biogenesis protein DipZ [Pseudomonadota bacterium]
MLLLILAYLGGILTIFSPCVLPVIPFIFSRSHLSFRRSGLPTLVGMGLSFTLFAVLSAAGGSWVIQANASGRIVAMVVFGVLGLTLLFPSFSAKVMQPFVRLGGSLQNRASKSEGIGSSLLIGASVGLLWAPCAGPILGLVLAGAAVSGFSQNSFALLGAFALGAATSLAIAILASARVITALKKGFGAEEWIKKVLGVLVLISVTAIAFGLDTKFLAKLSYLNTNSIEQSLLSQAEIGRKNSDSNNLKDEGPMPSLEGAVTWLNSQPLTKESLKGKVVLVDFWTYSCINCLRTLPYLKAWSEKYGSQGLVIIGVHSPEFAFEKVTKNVSDAAKDLGLNYPIAVDSDMKIWTSFKNEYWPAHYFVDAKGQVRYHHFGEGKYEESEKVIRELLKEANPDLQFSDEVVSSSATGKGVEQAAGSQKDIANPETYLGYHRQDHFVSAYELERDSDYDYDFEDALLIKEWGLKGKWNVSSEMITNSSKGAVLALRFKARDLHLVLGSKDGKPIRFKVKIDGKEPGAMHGQDIDAKGNGTIGTERLYQLIRKDNADGEQVFEIEFLEPGANAFAFTFG